MIFLYCFKLYLLMTGDTETLFVFAFAVGTPFNF